MTEQTPRLTTPEATPIDQTPAETSSLDRRRQQRTELRHRHASGVARLMDERADLRGVHALADFVDDAVRWTA